MPKSIFKPTAPDKTEKKDKVDCKKSDGGVPFKLQTRLDAAICRQMTKIPID